MDIESSGNAWRCECVEGKRRFYSEPSRASRRRKVSGVWSQYGRFRCLLLLSPAASAGNRPCVFELRSVSGLLPEGLRSPTSLLRDQLLRPESDQLSGRGGKVWPDAAA